MDVESCAGSSKGRSKKTNDRSAFLTGPLAPVALPHALPPFSTIRLLSAIARWITNRRSAPNSEGVITANAQFNHKIGPLQRGDVYEDPLIDFLEKMPGILYA